MVSDPAALGDDKGVSAFPRSGCRPGSAGVVSLRPCRLMHLKIAGVRWVIATLSAQTVAIAEVEHVCPSWVRLPEVANDVSEAAQADEIGPVPAARNPG